MGEPPHLRVEVKPGETKIISDSQEVRILGANLQQNLSWQAHLEKGKKAVLPAVRKQFGAIQQIRRFLNKSSRKLLAERLLMSKMLYLISQWGGATANYVLKAQRLQNRIARWITGSRRTKISSLLKKLDWLSISELTTTHSLTQLWKVIHMGRPEMISERITLNDDFTILIREPKLQFTQAGFLWRTTKVWNTLPHEIRTLKNLPNFKKKIKKWVKELRNTEPD